MSELEKKYVNNDINEDSIDIKELIFKYIRYWKWFVISVAVCLIIAAIYLRYSTKIYEVKTTVLLKDDKKGGGMADVKAFEELSIFDSKNNVDNELEILKSASLMEDVVIKMGTYFTYSTQGRVKSSEIYGNECPILFTVPTEIIDSINSQEFTVVASSDGKLSFKDFNNFDDVEVKANRYDSIVELPFGKVMMKPGKSLPKEDFEMEVTLDSPIKVAQDVLSRLNISLTGKTTSVVNITLKSKHQKKAVDLLNTYVDIYNQESIKDQNLVALNTADFINERLDTLTLELSMVERKVEDYKQNEELTDILSEAQLFLQKSSDSEKQNMEVETQLRIISDLESYISKSDNQYKLLPVGTGIESQNLYSMISDYNTLILQHQKLSRTAAPNNQSMLDITNSIDALRDNVKASISREKRNLSILKTDIDKQNTLYASKIRSIPRKERESTEIQRQQTVKASLYLFLLQKKEENYLSMTMVQPKAKIIDDARSSGKPISPKSKMIYFLALIAGLGLPILVLYLKDFFSYQIENKSELEKLTRIPILGEIPKSEEVGNIVLHEHSTNTLAEMYRLLRTNLLFVVGNNEKKVIMITSSVGGEGKTFMSINLALSLAFLNKKVLVMGLDVRKPKLAEYLDMDNKVGITLYLSGNLDKSKLIRPSGIHKNLDLIPAGPIPPNPNELLARKELDILIGELKEKYDFIILDTAPVGAVSDSFLINHLADVTIYLIRADYTSKQHIIEAEEPYSTGKLKNMYFVLNASDIKKSGYKYGYRYGYGKKYGYGKNYGYGYGENVSNK